MYNIGGFVSNPGLREVFLTEGVPEPEPQLPVAEEPVVEAAVTVTAPTYRVHTVVAGDSLYRIARNHLGRGARWGEIYELNRDIIANPRMIHIGWQLRIPAA